ncbi:MAG: metallophosphoesterase [Clostridia bacterium]|nr:metallophosphoesterase [Clostridia bacterium]
MKPTVKKILAAVLCVLLVLGVLPGLLSAAVPSASERQMQFNEDGKFKILQLADIQDNHTLSGITKAFIEQMIATEKPDLIVLTGDNIDGSSSRNASNAQKAVRAMFEMIEPFGIPVAATFGNHDDQKHDLSKEEQMAIYQEYKCNISVDQDDTLLDESGAPVDLEGCGTYNVPILSSDGSKVAFNLWILDSGSYDPDTGGYDHVRENQLKWMKQTAAALTEENGGEPVPSFVFQHIIVPNIYEVLEEVPFGTEGSFGHHKKFYRLPSWAVEGSSMNEAPTCSEVDGGEVDTVREIGGVLALISGHDHVNSFQLDFPNPENKEFELINTQTCGVSTYGLTKLRGVRVFELDENDLSTFTTRTTKYEDTYKDDFGTLLKYRFVSFWSQLQLYFINAWLGLTNLFGVSNLVA